MSAGVSRRMARSILRSLREVVGEAAFEAVPQKMPAQDWFPVEEWVEILGAFEKRYGDPETWQLARQSTRLAMAVAISKGWSTFLADATPEVLMERADTFWKLSYNAGELKVVTKKPRHVVLAIDGWANPPPVVGAMVAEACAVFLARMGERAPRAIDKISEARIEVDVTW